MNFDDTPEEAAFRARARAWIADNAPHALKPELEVAGFGHLHLQSTDALAASKAWQKKKAGAGWAAPRWPKIYGGGEVSPIEQVIWGQEEGVYAKLAGPFVIGLGMCGPTVMHWASEEQKRSLLPRLAAGEDIWCQLFSEPVAGSDLAGIRTRAERDGDEWVINGQKIWTSGALDADWGLLITRTDPGVAKHRGLTMFFLDMKSPGVEVRPIRQMNQESSFNEVYFTDVRIPDAQRLGAVGEGWSVALTTLMNERQSIGGSMPTGVPELFDLCRDMDLLDDGAVIARLAKFAARSSGLRYTAFRSISALSRGEQPGPENSIGKLVAGSLMQEVAQFALDLEGEAGLVEDPLLAVHQGRFQAMLLRSPATRIEGGSDEILRNIIAERVLGLPADIRVDKDLPFKEIPSGAAAR
ncbi:acyl-CoA dehydrogenase family protein [Sphingobium sp. HBC34]|uniref:Acyl-CoA dehydrogenase family protein n=1 Tax=Sphingobium cyanobacteriorum TaxID=3063954 RepID=A0ABT8ZPP8_9SPHN|nr:acyl-CoA dehydrogenase family protein [Sphingobium sp. HBC34]MDO7836418.1 acyl-CoA dehydrogenase family protein [Sphingobium sp. HBC34]